ncbi:Aspartokinase [Clydaea vesicula]|uniref:Aspartokinase n=1 Tax=Clydaea vesicula TaxID=447962 RepID=A0AAD5U6L9_9FUNG|nr:Aspartokinase [Clydaea vesicula]
MQRELVIAKFGGTSVGTAERLLHVASIVQKQNEVSSIVIVLSAMSSSVKKLGTTQQLLSAAEHVLIPNSTQYIDIINDIERDHLNVVDCAIKNSDIKAGLSQRIKMDCEKLRGEKLSARIMAGVLMDKGVNSIYLSLENLIDRKLFNSNQIDQKFYDHIVDRLKSIFQSEEYDLKKPVVPVVTGFIGQVPGSLLTTIGRGYTDLTAALIAVALSAAELQIFKEVDGIFSADPRKVPLAKLLNTISPEEAAELTYYGSEVIHPFTMEQVIRAKIPIRIKNTFNPDGAGTLILPNKSLENAIPGTENNNPSKMIALHATAATIKDEITVLNIHSNKKSHSHGFFSNIFQTLDRYLEIKGTFFNNFFRFGIIVDLISTSEVHISMALSKPPIEEAQTALSKFGNLTIIKNCAIISLVGKDMLSMVGIASRMFKVLSTFGVNIEMISQGASEINISCVVEGDKGDLALRVVHDECCC